MRLIKLGQYALISVFLSILSGLVWSSDDYHHIQNKTPGRTVFLYEGHFNATHPELTGFVRSSASDQEDYDIRSESESSEEFDDRSIMVNIRTYKGYIRQSKSKLNIARKLDEIDEEKINRLEETLQEQIDELHFWEGLLALTPEKRQEFMRLTDDTYRHDTECAVLLSGRAWGAAPLTPIIGVENLYTILQYNNTVFPIVCVNKYLCNTIDNQTTKRLYVTLPDGSKHLLSQINAMQYLELAKAGALIIEAMYNGGDDVENQRRYALDIGILSHWVNTKTPGAMILVGGTKCDSDKKVEEIGSLTLTSKQYGYDSLIMALGETSSSFKWDLKTGAAELSYPCFGCSLGTPIVTAAASQISKINPKLTAKDVRVAIVSSARSIDSKSGLRLSESFGHGVLDTQAALDKAGLMSLEKK